MTEKKCLIAEIRKNMLDISTVPIRTAEELRDAHKRDMQYLSDKMAEAKRRTGPPYKMCGVVECINPAPERLS